MGYIITLFILFLGLIVSGRSTAWAYCEDKPGVHADYRNKGLTELHRILSKITRATTSLDLSHNLIRLFPNDSMKSLSKLRRLTLAYNMISQLETRSLIGLESLCYLDLGHNWLRMTYESFPRPVFIYVPNLQELLLDCNLRNVLGFYPDEMFKHLVNLRKLSVDASIGLELGSSFSNLTNLEEFNSPTCNGQVGLITNSTFLPFSRMRLKTLKLYKCDITGIEVEAFDHLTFLKTLDLSSNRDLGLKNGLRSLYSIQHRNISTIVLSHLNPRSFPVEDTHIDFETGRFLLNICVRNLDLGGNRITFLASEFFLSESLLRNCLMWISVRGHRIVSINAGYFGLLYFRKLKYLDCSGRNPLRMRRFSHSSYGIKNVTFHIPPSLELLNVSHTIDSIGLQSPINFLSSNNFKILDMSYNGVYNCLYFCTGLHNLKVLNLTHSDCSSLSPHFLDTLPELEVLVLQNLQLSMGLENDPRGIFLRHQAKLTDLSIADNDLIELHQELFSSQRLVKFLNLANNKFLSIPQTVRSMMSLRRLDMSKNAITNLNEAARKWLDHMSVRADGNFYLSLRGNPLSCTCSTLQFILWLLETDVRLEMKDSLTCTLENGTKTTIVQLERDLEDFSVRCISKFWLVFSVSASSVVAVSLFLSVIGYRYRWNIKYWFLTRCRGGYEQLPLDNLHYDAFVAYNHEDYRWSCRTLREFLEDGLGYRICLHHRDFPAGESIQGNIVDAINTSRKIILVISRQFLRSDWGEFEIRMAGMRMVQSGRDNMIIVILLEEIPVRQMPRTLLNMWKNITFLLWTNDQNDQNLFWERLEEAMSRP